MERPGHLVVAYHGCDDSVRRELLEKDAHLKSSRNPYDWLGDGIYLYEDDWQRALFFAQKSHANPDKHYSAKPIKDPSVVGVVLRIRLWLDMNSLEARQEYAEAHKEVIKTWKEGKPLVNKAADADDEDLILRPLDRKVINRIHQMRKERGAPAYDAVRSHFVQGPKLLETSGFHRDTHVQIALLNKGCILGYFRVREAEQA